MPYSSFNFQASVHHAAETAKSGRSTVAEGEIMQLRAEVERLLMITESLWTFMKEQHGYTDDALIRRIAEIDIRDGKLDGRVAPGGTGEQQSCPQCSRPVGRKRPTCLYCGAALVRDPFER